MFKKIGLILLLLVGAFALGTNVLATDGTTYTVEFKYGGKEFVLEGGSSINLNKILNYLKISGDVEKATFSDPELVSVEKTDGKWMVSSKKPFKTNEFLDVVVDKKLYHITVTDAIISNRTIDNSWVFMLDDSNDTLTIKLKNGLTSGGLASNKKTEAAWKSVWQKSPSDTTDIRPLVKHIKFVANDVGTKFDFNEKTTAYMFKDFTNLEDIDFSGVVQDSKIAETMQGMFQNCSKLKKIDLSFMATKDNSLQSMQDLFNGCSNLEEVILNNSKFITRKSTKAADDTVTSGAAQMGRMFKGCSSLKTIDMSNITLYGRDNNWTQINNVFTSDLSSIETITMDNIKLPNFRFLDNIFVGLETLTKFSMKSDSPGDIAPDTETMNGTFKNSFTNPTGDGKATLDVSGLGKLNNILNMNDFISGCSGLEVLIIDNLDNTNIGPTNNNHSITPGQTGYVTEEVGRSIGAKEYGREIFGLKVYDIPSKFPNLKKVSAKESNVWLVKNNKGTPGAEYYDAGSDEVLVYLFDTKTTFTPDNKSAIEIDSKRDYVDMITDRDGIKKHTTNPVIDPLPDASSNLNILNNYNLNGAGHLASGVYEISDTPWEDDKIKYPDTYYRIAYIGEVPFKIEGIEAAPRGENGDDPELVLQQTTNYSWLNTRSDIAWPTSGDYTIDRTDNPIKITYEDAAIDVNGKKHNVVITIKKITFKNLEKIPTNAGSTMIHDSNRYIDYHPTSASNAYDQSQWTTENTGYYRTILSASRSDGVNLRNYVRVGDGNTRIGSEDDFQVLSGGSGTYIDFDIEIEKANDNTSFIFHAEDLDIAESQDWIRPNNDHDYEYLPIENATYGLGGESFVLGEGNDLSTVSFADHTGLKLVSPTRSSANVVVTTGSDPNTSWSEFAVKANAKGSSYRWESGVGCNTYALRNTPTTKVGEIEFELATKELVGDTLQDGQFEFKLTPDTTVTDNMATGSAITVANDENGNINFGAFKFDSPTVEIDEVDYYPGTVNDESNTQGNGTHISHTYAWIVEEIDGGNSNIDYDLTPRKLKIIIKTPENDEEMTKGIKAEVYVDDELVKTFWTEDVRDLTTEEKEKLTLEKINLQAELAGLDQDSNEYKEVKEKIDKIDKKFEEYATRKYTKTVVFKNTVLKEITLKANWEDDSDALGYRPDDLEGFVKYKLNGTETKVNTDPNAWTKEGNVWTYKFKIPKTATVTDWGEEKVPYKYSFKKEKHQDSSDTYEMTNTLRKYNLTIAKEVTGNKGDKTKEFGIVVKIFDDDKNIIQGSFNATVNGKEEMLTSTEEGIKLKVKHGDKIVIKDIIFDYTFEVEEEDTDYKEYFNVVNGSKKVIVNTTEGNKYIGAMDQDYTVTFTNNKQQIDPKNTLINPITGNGNIIAYIILLLSSLGIIYIIRKRLHN